MRHIKFGQSSGAGGSTVTKASLGLANVDNTSDVEKPVSSAQKEALDKKLSVADFTVLNALPGLPVTDVSLAYLANSGLCTLDNLGRVSELRDPLTGTNLSQTANALKPVLNVDDQGREYLRFSQSRLFRDGVDASMLGGETGRTTSFMFIGSTDTAATQNNFTWRKGQNGTYDSNSRIGVHLPWSTGILYVDYGNVTGGRLSVSGETGTTGVTQSYFYERNEGRAELWRNGESIGVATGLTTALTRDVGRFGLGGFDDNDMADMDFYGLFFYNRVLTNAEKYKMFLFSKKLFGV